MPLFRSDELKEFGRKYMEAHGIKLEPKPEPKPDPGSWIRDPERKRIIAVDFDGTIVRRGSENDPSTFQFIPGAKETLEWIFERFDPILWTCRNGAMLQDALNFLNSNGIYFKHINENVSELPFSTSSKIYADFYVDDKAMMIEVNWFEIKHHIANLFLEDDAESLIIGIVKNVLDENT